jgi:legumain
MFKQYLALSAVAAQAPPADHWAVIVAGSNGYGNYRHQADTCHAYQIMRHNGIPASNIIHLAYDDIANSSSNPFPGKVFNKPTAAGTPGQDVYAGCQIDYKGKDVTAANLLSVLKGDSAAVGGRKVLKSTQDSKVFFYFADHGAPGLVAMPVGGYLYADQFHKAIQFMNQNKMYKEMVIYMEACESGSMFQNILENNINVYALSAANASESSWATYCSPDDKVNGKSVGSCLGDLFSVNWMEDTDAANVHTETLQQQFQTVQKKTNLSNVLQWGQLSFTGETLDQFEANADFMKPAKQDSWSDLINILGGFVEDVLDITPEDTIRKNQFAIDSRDVQLHYKYNNVMREPTPENHQALADEIAHRMKIDKIFQEAFPAHMEAIKNGATILPTDFECYRNLMAAFEEKCEKMDDYSLKYAKALVAECEALRAFPSAIDSTMHRLDKACNNPTA